MNGAFYGIQSGNKKDNQVELCIKRGLLPEHHIVLHIGLIIQSLKSECPTCSGASSRLHFSSMPLDYWFTSSLYKIGRC